jgi:periplasmic divalent cation tolerance protein
MTDKVLVLTTAGSEAEANKIAEALVTKRLAACVNIVPRIQSVYRWKEKVETSQEFLLLVKTTQAHERRVQDAVRELHSYELPEHIAIAMDAGREDYLKWIDDSVSP